MCECKLKPQNMRTLLCLVPFIFLMNIVSAQHPEKQNYLVEDVVYEKVYLHVDREVYSPREDIWFKVYLVSGINNTLIRGYKNVYVQLVNDLGKVIDDRLVLISDGVAMGDIHLPYSILEGEYTIRAFTKYQKNFGEESFFHKKIWVSEMKRPEQVKWEKDPSKFDLSFFPESGNLVLNASNTVAFKATDNTGRGIHVSGYIVSDLGDTISPFQTEYLGMGSFVLMPREGRKYYAVVEKFPYFKYEFAAIVEDGIALNFVNENTSINFELARNFKTVGKETFIMEFSHKGNLLFSNEVEMCSFNQKLTFPKEKFPLGISKVSLKDLLGNILAERIIFIQAGFENLVEIVAEKNVYSNRERVHIDLNYLMEEYDSIPTGLSVSVVNRDYLNRGGYDMDMRSFLLLDSELKGPIEASAAYFMDDNISSSEKLNLLMMVQGWRSYYWTDIIKKEPEYLDGWDDYGLTVEGRVKRLFMDEFVYGGKVTIGPFSAAFSFLDTLTSSSGYFKFDRLYLRDSTTLMVEARTKKGRKNTEIFLKAMYEPDTFVSIKNVNQVVIEHEVPATFFKHSFAKGEAERKYAIESGTYWIEAVTIVEDRPLSFAEFNKTESDRMYGMPDKTRKITEDDQDYFNIIDYLEANPVMGLHVSGNEIIGIGGARPIIMVDGFEGMDPEHLHMGDIDYVDFLTSGVNKALLGSRGSGGAIMIYTKVGALSTFTRNIKGRHTQKIHGFQWPREFYSPKYELETIDSMKPDYRPTLFWQPFVFLQDSKAELEFYTSDFESEYLIIVEGISKKGKICTGLGFFSVGDKMSLF